MKTNIAYIDVLWDLFTEEYWQRSGASSRFWFLKAGIGHFVTRGPLLGYGPDEGHAVKRISGRDFQFQRLFQYTAYRDVYWIGMLIYYGPIGVGCFMVVLWRLFAASRILLYDLKIPSTQSLALTLGTLLIVVSLHSFVEQVLIVRVVAFYLWSSAGLVESIRRARDITWKTSGSASK